jgi:hypothetical protein
MTYLASNVAWLVLAVSVLGLGAGEGAHDEVVLQLPERDWGIRVAPPNFEFAAPHVTNDGAAVWAAGDGTDLALMMKVLLEVAPGIDDDSGCVARFEDRLGLDSQEVHHVVRSRHAGMPTIEYEVRQHGSVRVDQRNLHAYRFYDGTCAEFHVSLMNYKSQHRPVFDRVLTSIEVVEIAGDAQAEDSGSQP